MPSKNTFRSKVKTTIKKVKYFFPIQLIFVHLKNNPTLFVIWCILVATISKSLMLKYGVPYLFLTPEYLGHVSPLSYAILGFSFGGFLIAFNLSSYITNGHRFPFLATLSRPFYKYYINNFSWGIVLILTYVYFASTQLFKDGKGTIDVLLYMSSFLSGVAINTFLAIGYFLSTNKDFTKLFGKEPNKEGNQSAVHAVFHKRIKSDRFFNRNREWNIETYLSAPNKTAIARSIDHYDAGMLKKVFEQNHFNAALFEIAAVISIILLTFGSDNEYLNIPAGASLTLMFTILIMLTSAIQSWFRGWSTAVLLVLFLTFNFLSQFPFFNAQNCAYGMSYNENKVDYSEESIRRDITTENFKKDYVHTLKILEKWKLKNAKHSTKVNKKPKIIFINTTGGGMRSSMWSLLCMQHADSTLNGELLKHTQLITGSSGGMVGMSYLRELYLQKQKGAINYLYDKKYVRNMSKDILNRVGFMMCVNDLLFKFRTFKDGDNKYIRDRGYAFEKQLNINTHQFLDKRLLDYYEPELNSEIPMAIVSPTIVSDGRRLLISPQPISYLSYTFPEKNIRNNVLLESVEFRRFFKEQNAMNLKYTSALRMSSTFPYIMPIVHLPSKPAIEVMDSGLRDNFGTKTTLKFLYTFRNWIDANTSGVIIIQIRDAKKSAPKVHEANNTFLQSVSAPVDNIYQNMFVTQDYEHDQLIQYASEWFDSSIDIVDFAVDNTAEQQLSLSWHLTETEKKQVYNSLKSTNNKESLAKLQKLLN